MFTDPSELKTQRRGGLMCRSGEGCLSRFLVPGDVLVGGSAAARARDAHEREVHGYVHVPLEIAMPMFTKPARVARSVR